MNVVEEMRSLVLAKGPRCKFSVALSEMTADQRKGVEEALADSLITNRAVALWLEKNGFAYASANSVRHHRSGGCACPK